MRKNILNAKRLLPFFVMVVVLACASSAFANATIVIINNNAPGVGFNDPTPAAPIGGNPGTTLGQQRINAFNHAAQIWGATLDSPITIRILAQFTPLAPGVLGSAGGAYFVRDFGGTGLFPGAEFPATWYFATLADKRAGVEFIPGAQDINMNFSTNFSFYLGLDNNHGNQNNLVTVLLHEMGHGLNFANRVDEASGLNASGFTDIYARHSLDITTGLTWDLMTTAERQASAVNFGNVVWNGAAVTAAAPNVLVFGSPEVRVLTPAAIAGTKQFGTAQFGTPINALAAPVTGTVVHAVDIAEPAAPPLAAGTTTDGCSPFTNAAAIAGNIALIERGLCGFVVKAKNAQDAGAIGVMIYNNLANAAAAPAGMAGVDPTVIIPSVSISRTDGLAIIGQLPGVTAAIGKDPNILAGADANGRVRLYMPRPVIAGSSGSHYDQIAFKNLLMEPNINLDLTHDVSSVNGNDLTLELLRDVGWFADADNDGKADDVDCEPNSNFETNVTVDGCDSGVPNLFFTSGCTLSDLINNIAESSSNHGQFVAQTNHLLNLLKKQGIITAAQKDALSACVGSASMP